MRLRLTNPFSIDDSLFTIDDSLAVPPLSGQMQQPAGMTSKIPSPLQQGRILVFSPTLGFLVTARALPSRQVMLDKNSAGPKTRTPRR